MRVLSLLNASFFVLCFTGIALSQMDYPTDGTEWKVGQTVSATFKPGQKGETVNVFFNDDRSASLGGGPISNGGVFKFTVPEKAKAAGGSLLLAVHRINGGLYSVDSAKINVV